MLTIGNITVTFCDIFPRVEALHLSSFTIMLYEYYFVKEILATFEGFAFILEIS